ncbi:baseplate J/gp47 family protein [Paenibacillus sp. TAB 01]|uniref:baseplate J/gp47 family protein n=1 Tax=Paenibacillus sp. TAB 01 TaxID=3368988 RepID=UPI003750C654
MASKDEILSNMLSDVPDDYDKRAGSFIYDALVPAAEQFEQTDVSIQTVKDKLSINNLAGDELAQRINERTGITRKTATKATGSVVLTGTGTIHIGDLFETAGGTQFQATETKPIVLSGSVSIEAVIAGSSGNVAANTITLFPVTLTGFTAVNNPGQTMDGFEEESDTDLLQRYFDRIQTPATSGNKAHYRNWAKEVSGVGDARIISLWDGDNTVKVVVIDANRLPASTQLVSNVQEYIDPGVSGLGEGAAPIGAFVTVASAAAVEINISVSIVLSTGYTQQQAEGHIEDSLVQYFRDVAFVESIVSYGKTGAAILASDGVEDYSDLLINGSNSNIAIGTENVPVLGTVSVNVT